MKGHDIYKNIFLIFFFLLNLNIHVASASSNILDEFPSVAMDGSTSNALISGTIRNRSDSKQSVTYSENEAVNITLSIKIAPEDIGLDRELYIIANYNGKWFYKDSNDKWHFMDDSIDATNLKAYKRKPLSYSEQLTIASNEFLGPGEYLVYVGYLDRYRQVIYNKEPLSFIIFSESDVSPHRFQSEHTFIAYFKDAFQNEAFNFGEKSQYILGPTHFDINGVVHDISIPNFIGSSSNEHDVIHSNEQHLFTMGKCQASHATNCLLAFKINESPASNQLLSEYRFDSNTPGNFYLSHLESGDSKDIAITLNDGNKLGWQYWPYVGNYKYKLTELQILNVTNPKTMKVLQQINIEGKTIDSRLIDNTLYLVTRHTPSLKGYKDWYPRERNINLISAADFAANRQLLDDLTLKDIMPKITINQQAAESLHNIEDCYLPAQTAKKDSDRSIISITAIPLTAPQAYRSLCFVGPTETLHVAEQAVYIASNRSHYNRYKMDYTQDQQNQTINTEIHKLLLSNNDLQYQSSGVVSGHLGWTIDSKHTRIGEYNGQLNVLTAQGKTWDERIGHSLQVLKPSADNTALIKTGSINNLDVIGEGIFAARLNGKRGYVFTYKHEGIDPVYMLDLEDATNPKKIGSFQLDYDFKHKSIGANFYYPIDNTHLLIVHTKVADDNSKGLQISLMDVTDNTTLKVIQTMDFGDFPTYSPLLNQEIPSNYRQSYSPDTTVFVSSEDKEKQRIRFALPINLYDENISDPYNGEWIHTALYMFELDKLAWQFTHLGKLVTAEPIPRYEYTGADSGHTVLQGDAFHFFFNNNLYSQTLSNLE